jgi:hypothetical protein
LSGNHLTRFEEKFARLGGARVKKKSVYVLVVVALFGLTACRMSSILRSKPQENAFRERYIGKPFYTAIVLHPYDYGEAYLIDLTGRLTETAFETARSTTIVPLGTPITITAIEPEHLVAHIEGHTRPFRILPHTKVGALSALESELTLLLSKTPPLQSARPAMRSFIARQEVTRGMSRREVYMSWGLPDKVNSSPGSSGFLEEWIYFDRQMHLFLNDGFVTNWQQF